MSPLLIAPVFEIAKSLIERWFPDPAQKAQAEAAFLAMSQEQEFKKIIAQLEVNAREAASPHMFVAGWRPFVGWCSGFGFLYATIGQPVLAWVAEMNGLVTPPTVDAELLLIVLGGLLGLGTLRTTEKIKGATK
jgi:hypothetical protein